MTARGVETCPQIEFGNGLAFIHEAKADTVGIKCLPGDIFDGKAACSKVDPAQKLPPQC